jgi:diguanylate cyclase (GGDEF)-like protein
MGSVMFGYQRAEVVETSCQCDGAPECLYVIRLDDWHMPTNESAFLKFRLRVTEKRVQELERVIGDLVSEEDLNALLQRVTVSAARAIQASGFMLILEESGPWHERVYFHGLEKGDTEQIIVGLDEGPSTDLLVAEVVSARRRYGRLVARRPAGMFMPPEGRVLASYARLAATALDSACAVAISREESSRANALLKLASALAKAPSDGEVANELAGAIPSVVGCDGATVVIGQPGSVVAKVAASAGLSAEVERRLFQLEIPVPSEVSSAVRFISPAEEASESERATFAITGWAAGVTVPLILDGRWIGQITASVNADPERLRSQYLETRLEGLAMQAVTAIRNAGLVDQIRHQALHDPLTGLANRSLIMDRLENLIKRARGAHRVPAVLFLDLDGFKAVNDLLGHAAGDALLRGVADRLSATARPGDTVGRLGGDEFVVLVEDASPPGGVEAVAKRLNALVHQPFDLAQYSTEPVMVSASIGVAVGQPAHPADLLRDADMAMYQAKAAGKARFVVFARE